MFLIDALSSLIVLALPGPLLLALLLPRLFAPRGNQWAGVALYGGVWIVARVWMQMSPTFVG